MTTLTTFFSRITFVIPICCRCCLCCLLFFLRQLGTTLTTFFSHITSVIQVLSLLSVLSSVHFKTTWDNLDNFFLAHHFCHTQLLSLLSMLSSILSKDNLGQLGQLFSHTSLLSYPTVVVVVCVVFYSSTKSHCAANPSNLFYPCLEKSNQSSTYLKWAKNHFFVILFGSLKYCL